MKIIDHKTFSNNLEYLEELKQAEGQLNESIICLVDYKRNLTATIDFLIRKFENFGLEVTSLDEANIIAYFQDNEINYYTVKAYMIETIEVLKQTMLDENEFFKDFTAIEFFTKYMEILIMLCNASPDKKHFRKTIKKIVSIQTNVTKQNLIDFYGKQTERQVVNCLSMSIELYRFKKEAM